MSSNEHWMAAGRGRLGLSPAGWASQSCGCDRSVSHLAFLETDKKVPKKAPEAHPAGPRAPSPAMGPIQPPAQEPPLCLHHHKIFLAVLFTKICLLSHPSLLKLHDKQSQSQKETWSGWRWTVPPPAEISTAAAQGLLGDHPQRGHELVTPQSGGHNLVES